MQQFQKRNRLGTKIVMKCHSCKCETLPKNGDWHDAADGQIFLCRDCERASLSVRPKLRLPLMATTLRA